MIVVHFDPPLERKDFELVLPKVQEMFPDWEWCGNTGTPTVRDREKILPGAMKNQNSSGYGTPIYTEKIGSLIHYGRFKHYGEADCLGYSSGWSQEDTDSYVRQGHDVKVLDGWEIVRHGHLDIEDIFSSLGESRLKRIIRESIDEFEWVNQIPKYDLEGFYMTKPDKSYSGLVGNLVFIEKIKGERIGGLGDQFFVWTKAFLMNTGDITDYIQFIKHEMEHVKHDISIIPRTWNEPQKISETSIIQLVSDRYFIRLS
jgi:hypothetical protein